MFKVLKVDIVYILIIKVIYCWNLENRKKFEDEKDFNNLTVLIAINIVKNNIISLYDDKSGQKIYTSSYKI